MVRAAQITYDVDENGNATADNAGAPDPDQQKSYDEFRADLSGADSGYVVWVFKNPEDREGNPQHKGQLENMFTAPIDKYTMDEICQIVREEWMEDSDRKWMIRVQVRENGIIRLNKLQVVRKSGSTTSKKSQSQMAEVMGEVRRMVGEIENRVAARIPSTPPQNTDLLTMMKFMQDSQNQSMQTLAVLLTALKPANSGATDILTLVKTMGEVKNFASDLVPAGATEDSGIATLRALGPFAPLLKSLIDKKNDAPATLPALAAPAVNPAPIATPPPPPVIVVPDPLPKDEAEKAQMISEMRDQLKALAEIAPNKPPAEEVAQTLLQMLPTSMDDLLVETLEADNWFTRLTFIQPLIKPHEEWFKGLRDAILAQYTETPPGAPNNEGKAAG